MTLHIEEAWQWLKTAPLPVVLAFTLALGGWVWSIAADQRVDQAHVAAVVKQVDGMDVKLDKLLDGMAELRAEQRQVRRELRLSSPTPAATKEK